MNRISTIAAVAFIALPAINASAEKIQLKSGWKPGLSLVQKMQMDMEVNMAFAGQQQKMNYDMLMDSSISVGKLDAKKQKTVSVQYDRMAMEMSMAGNTMMKFDSKEGGEGPANPVADIVGKKINIVMDDKDKFVKFDDPGNVLGGAADNQILKSLLNENTFKEMMSKSGLYDVPKKPVGPGDSWPFTFEMDVPQFGKMGLKGRYTLKKFEELKGKKCAVIDMDATLAMDLATDTDTPSAGDDEAAAALKAMGLKIGGATMKGTLWFDNELGQARKSEIKTNMKMEMKNPESGEKMEMPIKQNILMTMEEKKK